MNLYALKFGLNASIDQISVMNALKNSGDEAIQASDGLYVRSARGADAFRTWMRENQFDKGVTVTDLDAERVRSARDTPADLKAFA